MANDRMDVLELLCKEAPDADLDFLREGLRVLIQAVMEAEAASHRYAVFAGRVLPALPHPLHDQPPLQGLPPRPTVNASEWCQSRRMVTSDYVLASSPTNHEYRIFVPIVYCEL